MAANDIQLLLAHIQEGIATVETMGPSVDLLHSIERDFYALLELAKLFLISERDSYYGYFLMSMRFRAEFCSSSIAGIRLGEYPPLFVSNPLVLCKFSLKEILYIICHEIEHVVLNHPSEMLKANPRKDPHLFELFNLAADASVNDRLDLEIEEGRKFLKVPEGVVNSSTLGDMFELRLQRLENYRYYYDAILETGLEPPSSGPQRMLASLADDVNGEPDGSDQDDSVVTAATCDEPTDHMWGEGDQLDAEEMGYVVREFVNSAVGLMSDEARGLMPADFMDRVAHINEPPRLSWQQILKKYVGTISAGRRKTRSRLNRRQPTRYDISGVVDDKVLKIVVAIDTSGSVDNEQLAWIFNEVFSIIAHRRFEMTVIECDAQVQRVYRVQNRSDVQLSVLGRGGTAFTPVIEYVNNDRYFRDALLIYFTDGWGERSIPRPRTYRNLWVLTRGTYISLEEPFGAVVSMSEGV